MFSYSADALAVRPRFFAAYNEVTIVVEDTSAERLYTQIMERVLGNSASVGRVLGMGGKKQVIQRYESRRNMPSSPPEFYLIDGDFDELLGRSCPTDRSFYRLERYDIESFLLEETAICLLAEEERPRKTANQYRREIQFNAWKTAVVDKWIRVAACAALLQERQDLLFRLPQAAEYYTTGSGVVPDEAKVESAISCASKSQSDIKREDFDKWLAKMHDRMGNSHCERLRWISGKNVWMPLMIRLLRRHANTSLNKESLCFRLAKYCEFLELNELRVRILDVLTRDVTEEH